MINLDEYPLFRDNKGTLKELSKDDHDGQNPSAVEYMTESDFLAVDFDKVKQVYANTLGHSEDDVFSVDGLAHTDTELVLIEFKNGKVNNKNIYDKIRDSLLVFCDTTNTNVSYTRQNMDFILVYNEDRNPLPNQLTKGIVQDSKSRLTIAQCLARLGKKEFPRFGIERFEKLYFKAVHTYSQEEFERFIPKLRN